MMIIRFFKKHEPLIIGVTLIAILIWSAFLRFYKLGNDSLWIDEGYTINAAQAVLNHGYPLLDSGELYDPHIANTYIVALSIKLFGLDPYHPWQARIPQAIFSVLGVYIFFRASMLTTKNLPASLVATAAFAFFGWHIAWARQARGYAEMQTFLLAAYYAWYSWFEYRKNHYYIIALSCVIAAILFQGVALVTLPLLIIFPIVYLLAYQPPIRNFLSLRFVLTCLATGILIMKFIVPRIPPIETYGYGTTYLTFFTTTFITPLVITVLGGLAALRNRTNSFFAYIIPMTTLLIPGIIIMFYSQAIQFRYLLVISPFIFILLAVSIRELFIFLKSYKDKYLPLSVALIIGYFLIHSSSIIPTGTYTLEEGSPQPVFNAAYNLIKKTKSEQDIIIAPYTPLTKIFIHETGYWLPISLTGRSNEVEAKTINGRDYYTNAPKVTSSDEFAYLINNHRGYVVIDTMARTRLEPEYLKVLQEDPRVTLVFQKGSPHGSIQVFHFN